MSKIEKKKLITSSVLSSLLEKLLYVDQWDIVHSMRKYQWQEANDGFRSATRISIQSK